MSSNSSPDTLTAPRVPAKVRDAIQIDLPQRAPAREGRVLARVVKSTIIGAGKVIGGEVGFFRY